MAGKSILMGSSTRYTDGAVKLGAPPAKATVGTLTAAAGKLIGRWTLPADPTLSTVLGFAKAVAADEVVEFPVSASPDEILGKVGKWVVEGYPIGQLVDAWVVTADKYRNPTDPTAANALYLGRAAITNSKKQLVGIAAQS